MDDVIEKLAMIFDKPLSTPKEVLDACGVALMELPDCLIVDKTSNPARTYLYSKVGNQLSQICLHNWKGTIWCLSVKVEDGKIVHVDPSTSAWGFLEEGFFAKGELE
jgi:hypothetical protein